MKSLAAAVLLLVIGATLLPETGLIAATVSKGRLQLTTSIVKETSCSPDQLSLKLRFTFRNVGTEPVIIDKQSFVSRSLISRSLKAALARQYEEQSRADLFEDIFPTSPEDIANFAIVRPGETYDLQTEQTRVSFLVNDGTPHSKDYLQPGGYFLQIEIATWTYLDDAEQYRRQWRANGLLWYQGLTSDPMPFTVAQNRPIEKCS